MRRRPPRPPGPAAAGLLMTGAVAVMLYGSAVLFLEREGGDRATAGPIPLLPPFTAAEPPPFGQLPVFAASDGVRLHLPSVDVVAVAFHEASYDDSTALRPSGVCAICRNRWKFRPPPPRNDELTYIVTDTRGRSTAATSAADVVLPPATVVLSPVTGMVTGVKRYRLYTRYPDVRIEIRPDSAPDRRVVMLHLSNVRLTVGDRVEASVTPIGLPRGFRFESQVDRYVPGGNPHVHIEVKDPAQARNEKTKR